jgi:hypothetical protein
MPTARQVNVVSPKLGLSILGAGSLDTWRAGDIGGRGQADGISYETVRGSRWRSERSPCRFYRHGLTSPTGIDREREQLSRLIGQARCLECR